MANDTASQTNGSIKISAARAKEIILLELARNFKGINPEIDRRIDANAARIYGSAAPGMTSVSGRDTFGPRVPLHYRGAPGQGKTSSIRAACIEFCQITGLNFVNVDKAPADWVPGENDFLFSLLNLSGKNNTSDFGGYPVKSALGEAKQSKSSIMARHKAVETGANAAVKAASQLEAIAADREFGFESVEFEDGALACSEMTLTGDKAQVSKAVERVLAKISADAKKKGVGISQLASAEVQPAADRLSYLVERTATGIKVAMYAPKAADSQEDEFVAAMLPNVRFALAAKSKFGMFLFDDVANANEQIRNVLLEVAQSNQYAGLCNLGNCLVSFTSNLGAADNTNTISRHSSAQTTREETYEIEDNPGDWAARLAVNYNDEVGCCFFDSFVSRLATPKSGLFVELPGAGRSKREVPQTNARALENAVSVVRATFRDCKASGIAPALASESIRTRVAARCGERVADAYMGYLKAMQSDAQPLAEWIAGTAEPASVTSKMTAEQFRKRFNDASGDGQAPMNEHTDFLYRFVDSLANETVRAAAFVNPNEFKGLEGAQLQEKLDSRITKVFERVASGLDLLGDCKNGASLQDELTAKIALRFKHMTNFGQQDTETMDRSLKGSTFQALGIGIKAAWRKKLAFTACADETAFEEQFFSRFCQVVSGTNAKVKHKNKAK